MTLILGGRWSEVVVVYTLCVAGNREVYPAAREGGNLVPARIAESCRRALQYIIVFSFPFFLFRDLDFLFHKQFHVVRSTQLI